MPCKLSMGMTSILLRRLPVLLLVGYFLLPAYLCNIANEKKEEYIVYMGAIPEEGDFSLASHSEVLGSVLQSSSNPSDSIIRNYGRSFNGFAAKLTESEKLRLEETSGVVSVIPNRIYWPHTTRSWDFLGLTATVPRKLELERNVIVGVIDTGIWPESKSFSDAGLGPVPTKWKGTCANFPCNKKIIGARFYKSGADPSLLSARDTQGHGTHTASTVAGVPLSTAGLNHIAQGTARGAVPAARLAIYKVCWEDGCRTSDILAAFDDAIADGVDIISISAGGYEAVPYMQDSIAIGAFHAMMKGILTSASAGNYGPSPETIANVAPWLMSVAASTTDRKLVTRLVLGNNETIEGSIAVNAFDTDGNLRPLITYSGKTSCANMGNEAAGNIVLCDNEQYEGNHPKQHGAYGQVRIDNSDIPVEYNMSTTAVSSNESLIIRNYVMHTSRPMAKIHKTEDVFDARAPKVALFSSRGPNLNTVNILKPDISAPGVNILAAWSPAAPTESGYEKEVNIQSGTSMACPHATGAAAYVKSFHPTWSHAAIRSALMTTAAPMSGPTGDDDEFAYGSGQINPTKAVNPGLIYDTTVDEYIKLLCSEGLKTRHVKQLTGETNRLCFNEAFSVSNFNYPSITVSAQSAVPFNATYSRRVTNMGLANSLYRVEVRSDPHITVTVSPDFLQFNELNEEKKYDITISSRGLPSTLGISTFSASIVWVDGQHSVRSPVIVQRVR